MDIDLLSKMVKELILDNDRVALPGLGCFVAEMVPSSFSDKGYTINPPYRRLYFRSRPDQGDALTRLYAEANGVEMEIADKIIIDFVAELKAVLFSRKTVIFPGLGRMRATKENTVFFVADEDLDIYPAGFGLEPVSLKTHQESAAEVSAAVEGLKHIMQDPEPELESHLEPELESHQEPEPESAPEPEIELTTEPEPELEPQPQQAEEPEAENVSPYNDNPTPRTHKAAVKALKVILMIVLVLAVLLCAYLAIAKLAPDWLDRLLYTKVQLEILNYKP
jgi:hypothetical protein